MLEARRGNQCDGSGEIKAGLYSSKKISGQFSNVCIFVCHVICKSKGSYGLCRTEYVVSSFLLRFFF